MDVGIREGYGECQPFEFRWLHGTIGLPQRPSGKEFTCKSGTTGDTDTIRGLGRSPGGEHDNPLQYLCLQNPMDRGASWATVHGSQRVRHD